MPPFFFGLTTYGMIGLNEGTEVSLVTFVLALVFTNVCATCACMAIGAAAKSVAVANAVASLCFLVATLFGGFLLNKDQIPWYARWVARLSFLNYGYEALVANEFAKNPVTFTLTAAWNSSTLPDEVPVPGEKVLSTFGFDSDRIVADVTAVCAQAVAFALLCYLMRGTPRAVARCAGLAREPRVARRRRGRVADDVAAVRSTTLGDRDRSADTAPLLGFASETPRGGFENDATSDEEDDDSRIRRRRISARTRERFPEETSPETTETRVGLPELGVRGALTDIDEESSNSARGAGPANPATRKRSFAGASRAFRRAFISRHALSWEGVTCDLVGGRAILRGVSGVAGVDDAAFTTRNGPARGQGLLGSERRESRADLFAILGPLWCGQVHAAGHPRRAPIRERVVGGSIRVNGAVAGAAAMRSLAGYVPQDDVLPEPPRSGNTSCSAGTLRIRGEGDGRGGAETSARIRSVVSDAMRSLGIDRVAHAFVGDEWTRGLSGGEKRRVSIATELLTSPAIMFLDEPTTGLDSTNAAKVVDILAALGEKGVTVVLSIHQPRPDVFRLLDRVLVMSATEEPCTPAPRRTVRRAPSRRAVRRGQTRGRQRRRLCAGRRSPRVGRRRRTPTRDFGPAPLRR